MAEKDFIFALNASQIAALFLGLILIGIILFPLIRWGIWKLFKFDKRVSDMLSQKKSSEVRLGKISECLAPVLDTFPVDVKKPGTSTVFLGQPVDFIHFDPDRGVILIEVKSGNSKLTATQRKIKDLVKDGRTEWLEFRVN